jgi:hypothetical protein
MRCPYSLKGRPSPAEALPGTLLSMPDITNPHDRFFEAVFSKGENARDFVRSYLPAPVVAGMDLDTLEPTKDSFIDGELRLHFSDLIV